ncbi:nudix (nucleoside diphosphate linked moiety X)-type motif 8, partial [Lunasporangiospora selenospora]
FPGGKRDSSDKTCLETALREMQEEIGIHPTDVEVLGEYSPVPNKDGTMRVQPYVGFVKTPLENLDILPFNRDEVQRVFAIPIAELLSMEKRTKLARFRDSKYLYPVYESACEDGCTVWGLTAFILDGVLRRIMSAGPTGALVCPEDLKIQRYRPPTFSAAYTSPVATSASSPAGPAAAQSFA